MQYVGIIKNWIETISLNRPGVKRGYENDFFVQVFLVKTFPLPTFVILISSRGYPRH